MFGALSYIIRPMFDEVLVAGDKGAIGWVATAIATIFLVRAVTAFCHRIIMESVGLKLSTQMQRDMLAHLQTLDSSFFQTNSPGTLIERVRGDTAQANALWANVLAIVGRDTITVIALLVVAVMVDPIWTLIAMAGLPLLFAPVSIMQRYVRRTTHAARAGAATLSTRLDEIFHGINTIKLNTSETHEETRFGRVVDGYLGQELKARIGRAVIPALVDIVAALGFAGVLVYGGSQIVDGEKTVGEFMSFFTAIGLLFDPLRRLANVTGAWQTARASLERIRQIFDAKPTILSPARAAALPFEPRMADIEFDDVRLSYGDEPALQGASFTAKAGETTALVGASGAGKSTVFNVLTRLVDADTGQVRMGGAPIDMLALADLRGLFAVVTQDAPLFDETLRDNIVLALKGVTEDQLNNAVNAAHLADFVASLPAGLDTEAGPRGSQLSGGQRQRVAIARAILRDAPVLLLDEATSALDAESEVRVQQALDSLSAGRTSLVIAHRLSTIRRADKIVVMDKGRVVDQGRHEDLLARGGIYTRLHDLQFSKD